MNANRLRRDRRNSRRYATPRFIQLAAANFVSAPHEVRREMGVVVMVVILLVATGYIMSRG
jgi:hypothetical protein